MYSFSYLEPVCCSMSSSIRCFLTCIQVSQEAGQVVWYSHLFQNFPQFIVIHTVKGFGIVNKAEVDVFLELSCFFDDPADVGNLISGSSAFSKTRLNIWKFTVHVLLKPGLENFEHYFTSIWDECNCAVVWAFFGIAMRSPWTVLTLLFINKLIFTIVALLTFIERKIFFSPNLIQDHLFSSLFMSLSFSVTWKRLLVFLIFYVNFFEEFGPFILVTVLQIGFICFLMIIFISHTFVGHDAFFQVHYIRRQMIYICFSNDTINLDHLI